MRHRPEYSNLTSSPQRWLLHCCNSTSQVRQTLFQNMADFAADGQLSWESREGHCPAGDLAQALGES
jgi:hypothetical protein